MHHEVFPRPCEHCDWLLNSSRDHFGLRQGEIVRVTMEFEVFKKTYGEVYIIHWRGPAGLVVEEAKEAT
jgi:hypothetical protein